MSFSLISIVNPHTLDSKSGNFSAASLVSANSAIKLSLDSSSEANQYQSASSSSLVPFKPCKSCSIAAKLPPCKLKMSSSSSPSSLSLSIPSRVSCKIEAWLLVASSLFSLSDVDCSPVLIPHVSKNSPVLDYQLEHKVVLLVCLAIAFHWQSQLLEFQSAINKSLCFQPFILFTHFKLLRHHQKLAFQLLPFLVLLVSLPLLLL